MTCDTNSVLVKFRQSLEAEVDALERLDEFESLAKYDHKVRSMPLYTRLKTARERSRITILRTLPALLDVVEAAAAFVDPQVEGTCEEHAQRISKALLKLGEAVP